MEEGNCDPLSLLRKYNVERKEILEEDDAIVFGKYFWPKNVNTNYFKRGCGKDGTSKEYYTLECLVNFLRNVNLPHPVYVQQAGAKGIAGVRRPDRKDLLKYLNGEITWSTNIDEKAPVTPAQLRQQESSSETAGAKNTEEQRLDESGGETQNKTPEDHKDNVNRSSADKKSSGVTGQVVRESEESTESVIKKQKLDDGPKEIISEKENLEGDKEPEQ